MDPNDRILVTGGSGFIGGRLVEVLAGRGFKIRVATSDFRHCKRISHLPIELLEADLSDHEALSRVVTDCQVVFHAAYRSGGSPEDERRINFDGTRALAEAFLKAGGRRFIQLSSIIAYGEPWDGEITEEVTRRASGNWYGGIKRRIELALLELLRTRGLAVTILQPTMVYGPYGGYFTVRLLEELRSSRIGLPAGGLCNAVYVDDVVAAAILAAEQEAAVGETFIISGSSPITWREFYGCYEKMLDKEAVVELNDAQIAFLRAEQGKRSRLWHRLLNLPSLSWALANARRFMPDSVKALLKRGYKSVRTLSPGNREKVAAPYVHGGFWGVVYAAKSHARIEKARKQLGYDPAFDLDEGMARTADWARSANLLYV